MKTFEEGFAAIEAWWKTVQAKHHTADEPFTDECKLVGLNDVWITAGDMRAVFNGGRPDRETMVMNARQYLDQLQPMIEANQMSGAQAGMIGAVLGMGVSNLFGDAPHPLAPGGMIEKMLLARTEASAAMVAGQVAADRATKPSDDVEAQTIDDLIEVARVAEKIVDQLAGQPMMPSQAPQIIDNIVEKLTDALVAFNLLPDPPKMPNAMLCVKAEHALRFATDDLRTARDLIEMRDANIERKHSINMEFGKLGNRLDLDAAIARGDAQVFSIPSTASFLEPLAGGLPLDPMKRMQVEGTDRGGWKFVEADLGVCTCHGGGARCTYVNGSPKCEQITTEDEADLRKLEQRIAAAAPTLNADELRQLMIRLLIAVQENFGTEDAKQIVMMHTYHPHRMANVADSKLQDVIDACNAKLAEKKQ